MSNLRLSVNVLTISSGGKDWIIEDVDDICYHTENVLKWDRILEPKIDEVKIDFNHNCT